MNGVTEIPQGSFCLEKRKIFPAYQESTHIVYVFLVLKYIIPAFDESQVIDNNPLWTQNSKISRILPRWLVIVSSSTANLLLRQI